MKMTRKIVEIDDERCDGCGQCATACAEGAIRIVDGKARVIKDSYCDGLGACIGECPQGALRIIEREADPFDHEAVEHHLEEMKRLGDQTQAGEAAAPQGMPMACGCPSSQIRVFGPAGEAVRRAGERGEVAQRQESALTHWPVQIRLVPPNAPFLKGAHLLVAADCTPVAYPNFHSEFLKDRVIMLGCPKFDDAQAYVQKFAQIFSAADIKSVTVVDMEVPCCSALPAIVVKAMQEAGQDIPMEEVVISVRGDILRRAGRAA